MAVPPLMKSEPTKYVGWLAKDVTQPFMWPLSLDASSPAQTTKAWKLCGLMC